MLPDENLRPGVDLFSWTADVNFAGVFKLEITLTGSPLLLTTTDANCVNPEDPTQRGMFYNIDVDGIVLSDPLSNEKINGVAQIINNRDTLTGQWYWLIPANSTFTADVTTQPGIYIPEWSSDQTYNALDPVRYQGKIYRAKISVPVNTLPTNSQYWELMN
jgi:hypothetical protein